MAPRAQAGPTPRPPDFQQVYAESALFVWRTLRRLGVREEDLEDVCQEAFVVVHRRLSDFDGSATVRTWLFGICRRVASDYRRRAHIRRETAVEELPEGAQAPEQVEVVARKQARALLDRILEELDEDKRAVFVLFELEQWPMAEVAQAVGCPLQTAYSRLYAGREHVKQAVARARAEGGAS
ncbi:RNA polymerase subunit sigma [Cystobacter ferrugineus]|uniref:RNA polymerase subunit sigma n=1 Tax=Cystobacter ferrugineus TaxID=83449 RepID=A0A1L9BC20_9BACT|nr:RNA polymerase subunit sigma [Cystobacter ferrugineus]